VSVEDVDLALLRGSMVVEGLTLGSAAPSDSPAPPIASWKRLELRLDLPSLRSGRIRLPEVILLGPSLRLERAVKGGIRVPLPRSDEPGDEAPPEAAAGAPAPDGGDTGWPLSVGRLELRDARVELASEADTEKLLELALAELAVDDLTLEGERVTLGALELHAPTLRLQRRLVVGGAPEGASAAPGSAGEVSAVSPSSASGPRYRIERVAIDAGRLTFESEGTELEVRLRLAASGVESREDGRFPVELELGVGEGEARLEGELSLAPPGFDGRLVWQDLPVPPLSLAADPGLASWIRSCRATGEVVLRAQLSPAGALDLSFSGTASLADFWLADSDAEDLALGWKQLELGVREATFSSGTGGAPPRVRVALDRLRLREPRARFTRKPAQAPGTPVGAAEPSASAPAGGLDLDLWLGEVELRDGSAEWVDRTVSPFFRGSLRGLELEARAVRHPELSAGQIRLDGVAQGNASFSARGELTKGTGSFSASLDRLPLPPFNPYATGVGARLGAGEASLDSELRISGKRVEARNELVLHGLELTQHDETRFRSRVGVPFKLAIALLEDARGDIALSIPVTLEQGVRVDLRSSLPDAFYGALRGAVRTPLELVGAALPTGPAGAAPDLGVALGAEPGAAELDDPERTAQLAALLATRPELGVMLHGRALPDAEPELALQLLVEHSQAGEELPALPEVGWVERRSIVRALEALSRDEPTELDDEGRALLSRYAASVDIPPERLEALARARAEGVRERLVSGEGVALGRIGVRVDAATGPPRVAAELVPAAEIGALSAVW
jgi:hypothetical protein